MRICVLSLILSVLIVSSCYADAEKEEAYRRYFSQLSTPEKKAHMKQIIVELRSSLPMVITDYHQWTGVVYIPTQNILLKTFNFNLDYNSIDHSLLPGFERESVRNSINSLCTGNLYKTWMFEAGLTIRNNFATVANQNLFNYSITKDDCLETGYKYP